MIIASLSSFLFRVKSSASRAQWTSNGWTHTSRAPHSATIWSSTRHRCPVGSEATTTEANPASAARASPPLNRLSQLPRLDPDGPPGEYHRVLVGQRADLLVRGQIKRQHRRIPGHHRPQPGQPVITATIPTREPRTTITT